MEKYVIDTSVAFKLFADEEDKEVAIKLFKSSMQQKISLLAPSLILNEILNSFIVNGYTEREVSDNLKSFERQVDSGILNIVHCNRVVLLKACTIASLDTKGQGYISSYDATFHALALLENALLITADKKHFQKTKNLVGSVRLLEDF